MPLPYHLIDGYNLLHAAGFARASYGPGDLERCRTALLLKVADGLDEAERERATVVFDAADPPPDAERKFRFRELTILFAADGGDADALIEELIRRHPSPRQVRVVSDDIRLQKAAKRRGCQAVKSDAFLRRLKRRDAPGTPSGCSQGEESAGGEIGDWLSYFRVGEEGLSIELPKEPPSAESVASPKGSKPEPWPPAARSSGEKPAAGKAKRKASQETASGQKESVEPADDFGFWQRRINEMLADEGDRPTGG